MEHIGMDVHKKESQVCVLGEGGEVVLERRVATQREKLSELLGKRPKARVLLESSTQNEWVARCLEQMGHEVVVADPHFASMYAMRSRRVKTDKRDARTLAEANRLGAYRPAHFIDDASLARVMRTLHDWAAPGSVMALSHAWADELTEKARLRLESFKRGGGELLPRSEADLRRLVAPWEVRELAPLESWPGVTTQLQESDRGDTNVSMLGVYLVRSR